MGWVEASIVLFGSLVALMSIGLPVAFGFLERFPLFVNRGDSL
jgi:hypothetical protein